MKLPEIQNNLCGEWTGNNLLRLSWLTPSDFHSGSRMTITPIVKGKFLSLAYTWSHDDIPQEGHMIVGFDETQAVATAGWGDSWHQSAKVLHCQGSIDENGAIDVRGSYEAPPGPDWGWRIVISSSDGDKLTMSMYNCPPEGDEDLAVKADYTRP